MFPFDEIIDWVEPVIGPIEDICSPVIDPIKSLLGPLYPLSESEQRLASERSKQECAKRLTTERYTGQGSIPPLGGYLSAQEECRNPGNAEECGRKYKGMCSVMRKPQNCGRGQQREL